MEAAHEENEYERQRLETIARNRARLQALGIPGMVAGLQEEFGRWVSVRA